MYWLNPGSDSCNASEAPTDKINPLFGWMLSGMLANACFLPNWKARQNCFELSFLLKFRKCHHKVKVCLHGFFVFCLKAFQTSNGGSHTTFCVNCNCFHLFQCSLFLLTWSSLSSSSGVSGNWPNMSGGLILTSFPRERTTSSRLYRSANTHDAGIKPWTV